MLRVSDQAKALSAASAPRRAPPPTRCATAGRRSMAERIERAERRQRLSGKTPLPCLPFSTRRSHPLPPGTPAADGADARIGELRGSTSDERARSASRSLRVDESKIDALVNLAGELIVAEEWVCASRKASGGRDRRPGPRAGRQARAGCHRAACRRDARGDPAIADGAGRAGLSIVSTPRARYVARAQQES